MLTGKSLWAGRRRKSLSSTGDRARLELATGYSHQTLRPAEDSLHKFGHSDDARVSDTVCGAHISSVLPLCCMLAPYTQHALRVV